MGMNPVRSKFQVIAASIATLYFALFSIGAYWIISQFEEIFDSFGMEMPIQTSVIMGSYRYWGVLAVISAFILFRVSQSRSNKAMDILVWLVVLSLLLIPFIIWGLYGLVLEHNVQGTT